VTNAHTDPQTTDPLPTVAQTDAFVPHSQLPRSGKRGTAGLVSAGAMTALLSGDVRLAVRATRLVLEDQKADSDSLRSRPASARLRRVWKRPVMRERQATRRR
jgi:L-aminopeptidase/D-esterase-like protein